MLVRSRVVLALEAKKDRFSDYQLVLGEHVHLYQEALDQLSSLSRAEIEARLAEAGIEWPGARPTVEHDQIHNAVVGFDQDWRTHEAARAWARRMLVGQTTFAVDGSQIPPSTDFSVPVGAVQVAWFENRHAPGGQYVKDLIFEVLAPEELSGTPEEAAPENRPTESAFPDSQVNLRRFETECHVLASYIQAHGDERPAPVCFLDGSLVVSFVRHMSPELRRAYVLAVTSLMRASRDCRVPLVGYVDTSYAHDLLAMLACVFRLPQSAHLNDGNLLRPQMQWGERSQVYLCARDDKVLPLYDADSRDICFTYLKTTGGGSPARLEFPGWLARDAAELERSLAVVRAECVVGNGYPYALETADAVAVVGQEDRKRFYAAFQEFARREGLNLRYSRKALSKKTRR